MEKWWNKFDQISAFLVTFYMVDRLFRPKISANLIKWILYIHSVGEVKVSPITDNPNWHYLQQQLQDMDV